MIPDKSEKEINSTLFYLFPFDKIKYDHISSSTDTANHIFVFKIKTKRKILNTNTIFQPGQYLYKRFYKNTQISLKTINYFLLLSKLKLIPKIYLINKKCIIMKYLNALPLSIYIKNNIVDVNKLIKKLSTILKKWHELEFTHGDLTLDNILISSDNQIYLIDPYPIVHNQKYDLKALSFIRNFLNSYHDDNNDWIYD